MRFLLFLLLTGSLGLSGGLTQTSAQTPDRQQLWVWHECCPHHEVKGLRKSGAENQFSQAAGGRQPPTDLLGQDFLDGLKTGALP